MVQVFPRCPGLRVLATAEAPPKEPGPEVSLSERQLEWGSPQRGIEKEEGCKTGNSLHIHSGSVPGSQLIQGVCRTLAQQLEFVGRGGEVTQAAGLRGLPSHPFLGIL